MAAIPPLRPDDQPLAAAKQRITSLEMDLGNLRKGMVQQLTSAGKLLKAIFAIDQEYFGGRFRGQQKPDAVDPLRDLAVATQIAEAVSEELQGSSAFADSPLLRDHIANLLQTFDTTRTQLFELDKASINAVGLPVKPEPFKARVFPENNPLACLAESTGFVHEVVAAIQRIKDRLGAMRMMLDEAERGRQEAESAVTPVDVDAVAGQVAEELRNTQSELTALTARYSSEQTSLTQALEQVRVDLAAAQLQAACEADWRVGERADLCALAAEILQRASTSTGHERIPAETLQRLGRAVLEPADTGTLVTCAEHVLVAWSESVAVALNQVRSEAQADHAGQRQLTEHVATLERQIADAAKALAEAKREAERAQQQITASEQQRNAIADQLPQLTAARDTALAAVVAITAERDRLRTDVNRTTAASGDQGAKLVALQTQLEHTERLLSERTTALTASDARCTAAEQARDAATTASADAKNQLAAIQKTLAQRDQELAKARTERDQLSSEQAALNHQQLALNQQLAALTSERDGLAKQRDEITKQCETASSESARLRDDLKRLDASAGDAGKQVAALRSQSEDAERRAVERAEALAAAETRLTAITRARDAATTAANEADARNVQTSELLAKRDAAIAQAATERERLAKQQEQLTNDCAALREQLAALKTEQQTNQRKLTDVVGTQQSIAHDRDELTKQVATLTTECDKLLREVKAGTAAVADRERAIADISSQLTTANQQFDAKAQALIAAEQRIAVLQHDAERLRHEGAASDQQLVTARRDLQQRADELASAKQELVRLSSERERGVLEADRASREIATLKSRIDELEQQSQTQSQAVLSAAQTAAELARERDAQTQAATGARAEAERRGLELEALRGQLGERTADIAALEKRLAAAEQTQDDATKNLQAQLVSAEARVVASEAELAQARKDATELAAAHAKDDANLDYIAARERQLEQQMAAARNEKQDLAKRLDEQRRAHQEALTALQRELDALRTSHAASEETAQAVLHQRNQALASGKQLDARIAELTHELGQASSERDHLQTQQTTLTVERDRLAKLIADREEEFISFRTIAESATAKQKELSNEADRLRIAEQEARRAESDATSRAQRLTGDLSVLRERIGGLIKAKELSAQRDAAREATEKRLADERDAATTTAAQAATERDRLKHVLEQVRAEQADLDRRLEEQQIQATARATEASRLLSEARNTNARLAGENERLQADLEKQANADQRRVTTGTWNQRLQDSLTAAETARQQTAVAEAATAELRTQLADLEERLARQTQAAENHQERTVALASAENQSDAQGTRIAALEQALATANQRLDAAERTRIDQRRRFEEVLRAAREAVARAKEMQERTDTDDRAIIANLMNEVRALRLKTGTLV